MQRASRLCKTRNRCPVAKCKQDGEEGGQNLCLSVIGSSEICNNCCFRYFAICRPTFYLRHRASHGNSSPLVDIVLSFYSGLILQVPRFLDTRREILAAECLYDGGGVDLGGTASTASSGTESITEPPCPCLKDKNVIKKTN